MTRLTHPTDAVTDGELLAMLPATAKAVTAQVAALLRARSPEQWRERIRQRLLELVNSGRAARVETRACGCVTYEYRLIERRAA